MRLRQLEPALLGNESGRGGRGIRPQYPEPYIAVSLSGGRGGNVLPWAQFLYAEGTPNAVRAVFSMHDLVVTGCGLDALLADVAAQVVMVLQQPLRANTSLPGPARASWLGRSAGLRGVDPRDLA